MCILVSFQNGDTFEMHYFRRATRFLQICSRNRSGIIKLSLKNKVLNEMEGAFADVLQNYIVQLLFVSTWRVFPLADAFDVRMCDPLSVRFLGFPS